MLTHNRVSGLLSGWRAGARTSLGCGLVVAATVAGALPACGEDAASNPVVGATMGGTGTAGSAGTLGMGGASVAGSGSTTGGSDGTTGGGGSTTGGSGGTTSGGGSTTGGSGGTTGGGGTAGQPQAPGGAANMAGAGGAQEPVEEPIALGLTPCKDMSKVAAAAALTPPTIDGDLSDWDAKCWYFIQAPKDFVQDGGGAPVNSPNDISTYVALQYTADTLYLAAVVVDDVHTQTQTAAEQLWHSDSIQFAFDMAGNGGVAYDKTDDFEYGWALTTINPLTTKALMYRWNAPSGSPQFAAKFSVARLDPVTRYEIALPAQDLGVVSFPPNSSPTVSWMTNDDDEGEGRLGWVELTPGIGDGKLPSEYAPLVFGADGAGGAGGAGGAAGGP